MPEGNAGRRIHIRMGDDLHRRPRIRCAEFDTTILDYVVELLDRVLSGNTPRRGAKSRASTDRR